LKTLVYTLAKVETNELEAFVELAASELADVRVLDGIVSDELVRLFDFVRSQKGEMFARLAQRAFATIRRTEVNQLMIAAAIEGQTEYDFAGADALWVSQSSGQVCCVVTTLDRLIELGPITIPGSYLRLSVCEPSVIVVNVIAIHFARDGVGFAVHFINYLVQIGLLLPEFVALFEHIQSGGSVLFPATVGRWFTRILEQKLVSGDLLQEFGKSVCFEGVASISDPILACGMTLFSAYVYSNARPDMLDVRERIVEFVDDVSLALTPSGYVASRIGRALVNPFSSELGLLGLVSDLQFPVLTRIAYPGLVKGLEFVIDPSSKRAPSDEELIAEPNAVAYRVIQESDCDDFMTVNGEPVVSGFCYECSEMKLRFKAGASNLPKITVVPIVSNASVSPLDWERVIDLWIELSSKLTIASDSLLFAIATTKPGFDVFDDALLQKILPELSPDAARLRIGLHEKFVGHPGWPVVGYSQASWLSGFGFGCGKRAKGSMPGVSAGDISSDLGWVPLFAKLDAFLPIVPVVNVSPTRLQGDSMLGALLAATPNKMFERGKASAEGGPALLPMKNSTDFAAFTGFGRWLSLCWAMGKGLCVPLSRVVIRVAFGGTLRADDFADVDREFAAGAPTREMIDEWMRPFARQMHAIRAGAASGVGVCDDELLPRVFQLRPLALGKRAVVTTPRNRMIEPVVRRATRNRQIKGWQDGTRLDELVN
jgi:hypothetical protein